MQQVFIKNCNVKDIFIKNNVVVQVYKCSNKIWSRPIKIQLAPNDDKAGTVSGNGTYYYRDTITLEAIPNTGYIFEKWSDGITASVRKITALKDVSYIAFFKLNIGNLNYKENYKR